VRNWNSKWVRRNIRSISSGEKNFRLVFPWACHKADKLRLVELFDQGTIHIEIQIPAGAPPHFTRAEDAFEGTLRRQLYP
jgi:hypothetical protein